MSLQERLKAKNETFDKIDHLMERWEQRVTLHNLRLADRFINLELHILLDLVVKDTGERWIACSDCIPTRGEPVIFHDCVIVDGKDHPVFVDIVEFVDLPKKIIPAFIRLKPIDSFYSFGTHTLYFGSLVPFVSCGVLRDRKLDTTRRRFSRDGDQMICKVVKCSSEVLDHISGTTQNVEGKNPNDVHIMDWRRELSRCKICIGENNVTLLIPEDENFPLNIQEMLLGPLNFYPNQVDSVVGR